MNSNSTWNNAPYAPGPQPIPISVGQFKSAPERLEGERERRLAMRGKILSFGVRFLDLTLGGIFPNDLVLIGAKTGIGKTALASLIACSNAVIGKRVHYFALEAEDGEIERRLKFSRLSQLMHRRVSGDHRGLNFLDWYKGRLDQQTGAYEVEASDTIAKSFLTLRTFYRDREFYAENFEAMTNEIQNDTDLIILDHLHFVDSDDANENRGYKTIVKRIRDVALRIGKPVVVVAHLRKGDRRSAQLVPDLDDFHGSSDISKMATKAIMIAPAYGEESGDPCLWPTYLSPAKCRFDGTRTRYVGLATYDARTGMYADEFELGRMSVGGDEFKRVPTGEWPEWSTRRDA